MPRKTKAFLKRSAAAKKGWVTRRRNKRQKTRRKTVSRRKTSSRKMWRVTVAAPYFIRRHGKRKRGRQKQLSPASAAYMVTGWFRTRADAKKNERKLIRRAIRGRTKSIETNPNATYSLDHNDPTPITPDVQVKDVPFRAGFIGRIEEVDEH